MWANESIFYQIYPLGFCGAPFENDGVLTHRINKVNDWIPHLEKLNVNAIYFSPIFESDTHGYNTRDYTKIDCRLGTNEDFANVCDNLHKAGIKVVLDGVFNHVGRGFFAFLDVKEKRENSPYCSWFHQISFEGNSNYDDGFWYEGWEGNYDLVKLNLYNDDVINYLFDAIRGWVKEFKIDGLRLDVAYCLNHDFIRKLRNFCESEFGPDFFLLGEMIHGDYNQLLQDGMLHATTNYECYKGLYSSFNCMNMFEINHSLIRQFGNNNGAGIYSGKNFLTFVDNHDVERIASILSNPSHLPLVYATLFGMPGIPCIYYGSEWGALGKKSDGDPALRPCFEAPISNELTDFLSKLAAARTASKALCHGIFSSVVLTNERCVFAREFEEEKIYVCINAKDEPFYANLPEDGTFVDLITGEKLEVHGGLELPRYCAYYLKKE